MVYSFSLKMKMEYIVVLWELLHGPTSICKKVMVQHGGNDGVDGDAFLLSSEDDPEKRWNLGS